MLLQPTLEKLEALKLTGMVKALREQLVLPDMDRLTFEERLGLLVERYPLGSIAQLCHMNPVRWSA